MRLARRHFSTGRSLRPDLELGQIIPSIGFHVERICFEGQEFVGWDVGGRAGIRGSVDHYFPDTDGIIFMVDSSDKDLMEQARDALWRLANDPQLQGRPKFIICKKQDLPNASPYF